VDAGSSKFHAYQIILQPALQFYTPGSSVVGRVVIHPKSEIKCRNVRLSLLGELHTQVQYTVSNGRTTQSRTAHHTEELLKTEVELLTGALSPQMYVFPFTFIIPNSPLPSSFDPKVTLPITYIERIDTNLPGLVEEGDRFEVNKTLCCCCCASGPLQLLAFTKHRGYVAGEDMEVVVAMSNHTGKVMGPVTVIIKENKWKSAEGHTHLTTKNVESFVVVDSLATQDQPTSKAKPPLPDGVITRVKIPALTPTINVNNLKITYAAKVNIKVPGGLDLSADLPIIIGTVPRVHG